MAILHLRGTRLEPETPAMPLNKPFLFFLALLFLVAAHFFMPNPGVTGLELPFNVATWTVAAFPIATGLLQICRSHSIHYSKLTAGLLLCCIMLTIPVFYTHSGLSLSALRLAGLWSGFLLFVSLQQFRFSNKHKQRLLWFISLSALIEALYGLMQLMLLPEGNIFGYHPHQDRPYGIFQHSECVFRSIPNSHFGMTRTPISV